MEKDTPRGDTAPDLELLRSRIDDIDAGLIDLIGTRMEVAREISAVREAAGLDSYDLAREAAIVRRASRLARARGLEPEAARELFWRLMGLSRWASENPGGLEEESEDADLPGFPGKTFRLG